MSRHIISVHALTVKIQEIEKESWWDFHLECWKVSKGFRMLLYFPGITSYRMLHGQLREGEILCGWFYPPGQTGSSVVIEISEKQFKDCNRTESVPTLVGFYGLTVEFCQKLKELS